MNNIKGTDFDFPESRHRRNSQKVDSGDVVVSASVMKDVQNEDESSSVDEDYEEEKKDSENYSFKDK